MLRRSGFNVDEVAKSLPKEAREKFLSLDPAEQELLMNGSDVEREQYGWLPPLAAKRYAKLDAPERLAEARAGQRLRRLERKPFPVGGAQPSGPSDAELRRHAELWEAAARVAATARDIFEFPASEVPRVQSMALNLLSGGCDEAQALDRIAEVLIDDVAPPASEAPPSRVQVRFSGGGMIRG